MSRQVRAFVAILLTAGVLTPPAMKASSVSAQMTVSAYVIARTRLTLEQQPRMIAVTTQDLARGFVEVPAAMQFRIRSNSKRGYVVRFEALPRPFVRAHVRWGGTEVVVRAGDGAMIAQPYSQQPQLMVTDVRLDLGPDAAPGNYPWPIDVTADSV